MTRPSSHVSTPRKSHPGVGSAAGSREPVTIRVTAGHGPRLMVGSCWRVVPPSLEARWEDPESVTLEAIDDGFGGDRC
jgi:hypothetical protein